MGIKSNKVGDQTIPGLDIKGKEKISKDVREVDPATDFNIKEIDFLKNVHQELLKEISVQKDCVGVSSIETNENEDGNPVIIK